MNDEAEDRQRYFVHRCMTRDLTQLMLMKERYQCIRAHMTSDDDKSHMDKLIRTIESQVALRMTMSPKA